MLIIPDAGDLRYEAGTQYLVYVQARDRTNSDKGTRDSDVAILDIRGGERPPQFFQQAYAISVPEDTPVHARYLRAQEGGEGPCRGLSVLHVQARSFANRPNDEIRFTLFEDGNGFGKRRPSSAFSVDERSGVVRLTQPLDFDDPLKPRLYKLKGNPTSHRCMDARLGLKWWGGRERWSRRRTWRSQWGTSTTRTPPSPSPSTPPPYRRTTPSGSPSSQVGSSGEGCGERRGGVGVSARDADEGVNGELRFELSEGEADFAIDHRGLVTARRRLDADQKRLGFHIYKLKVTARDQGKPQRIATSTVSPLHALFSNRVPCKLGQSSQVVFKYNISRCTSGRRM